MWVKASFNRHYIVALASLMALVALSFQPISAALFSVRDIYKALPGSAVAIIFVFLCSLPNLRDKCDKPSGNFSEPKPTGSRSDKCVL